MQVKQALQWTYGGQKQGRSITVVRYYLWNSEPECAVKSSLVLFLGYINSRIFYKTALKLRAENKMSSKYNDWKQY